MKDKDILLLGGIAVGGYIIYKSGFFQNIGEGLTNAISSLSNVSAGFGSMEAQFGTGASNLLSETGNLFTGAGNFFTGGGNFLTETGAGVEQIGQGAGTFIGGSAPANIITALENLIAGKEQYYNLPPPPVVISPNGTNKESESSTNPTVSTTQQNQNALSQMSAIANANAVNVEWASQTPISKVVQVNPTVTSLPVQVSSIVTPSQKAYNSGSIAKDTTYKTATTNPITSISSTISKAVGNIALNISTVNPGATLSSITNTAVSGIKSVLSWL